METRADFYVGRGPEADWIGSIAWDGYPEGIDDAILKAKDEATYLSALESFAKRDDFTKPEEGWPWPWTNSATTDYAYALDDGQVYVSCFGSAWRPADKPLPDEDDPEAYEQWEKEDRATFPEHSNAMKEHSAKAGSNKSGIMIFGG